MLLAEEYAESWVDGFIYEQPLFTRVHRSEVENSGTAQYCTQVSRGDTDACRMHIRTPHRRSSIDAPAKAQSEI